MKHKVGDKVKIKSKEWWDAQPKNESGSVKCGADTFNVSMASMCGKVVEISDVTNDTYFIKESGFNWTDEMFEEDPTKEENSLFKAIIEAAKQQPLLVEQTEDGGVKISPLKAEKEEEDLPIDTPVMVGNKTNEMWCLRYYAYKGKVFLGGLKSKEQSKVTNFDYIIPFRNFDPLNIEESLKYNIVKK